MNIIGFDVSKAELVGARIDKSGKVKESFVVTNTKEDIEIFLATLPPKVTIGCEATGEYHNELVRSCLARDIRCMVLNPIVTKQYTRSTVRKRKTDKTDAEVIARCILQGEGVLATSSTLDVGKRLLRTAADLAQLKVSVSHMRKGFAEHWSDSESVQEALSVLEEAVETAIVAVRKEGVASVDTEKRALLTTIPGVGDTLAATIISEVGDIERFRNVKSLIAFAGLDPKVRQSGTSLNRNSKITKRGSPYLRRATYIAASIGQRYDAALREYHLKKRVEGKRYKEATVANARHLLARAYAVLKRGTPYVPAGA